MNSRFMISISLFIAVIALFITISDDSSAEVCDNVDVYIQDPITNDYEMSTVSGVQTVRAAVQAAMDAQGHVLELNLTETNIKSVDGYKNTKDWGWRLFQWLPDGNNGWGMQTFQEKSDERMRSGCTLCVTKSTMTMPDNIPVYSVPDFKPKSTGYFFIRFANGFNPVDGTVNEVFTPEIRQHGFWIEGKGTNMGEVLVDAVNRNWPGQIEVMDGIADSKFGPWVVSMLGLKTVNLGDGAYAYWSQWTWQDHTWEYNNWTLDCYDPAVYQYMECIYMISSIDPYDGSIIADKGGPEPNPEVDGILCLKNKCSVTFEVDGSLYAKKEVKYGTQVDTSNILEPNKNGYLFEGWGDVSRPVTSDVVFTADFAPVMENQVCITYMSADYMSVFHKEYLISGSDASFSLTPHKLDTREFQYVFTYWDAVLKNVTSDKTVYPVYSQFLKKCEVIFFDPVDGEVLKSSLVDYGGSVSPPEVPVIPNTDFFIYKFKGWSSVPNVYSPVDLSFVMYDMSVFPVYDVISISHCIHYHLDNGEISIVERYKDGTRIIVPEIHQPEGYVFDHWEPALPEFMPEHDIHVRAVWKPIEYNVCFDYGTGDIFNFKVPYGTSIPVPDAVLKPGHSFLSWNMNVPDKMPSHHLEFKAIWEKLSYRVSFITGSDTVIEDLDVPFGDMIEVPADPLKEGNTFAGWKPSISEPMPDHDVVFTAEWELNSYRAIFVLDKGLTNTADYVFGSEITYNDPECDGYDFIGWNPKLPDAMPAKELTFTAMWKRVPLVNDGIMTEFDNSEEEGVITESAFTDFGNGVVSNTIVITNNHGIKTVESQISVSSERLSLSELTRALEQPTIDTDILGGEPNLICVSFDSDESLEIESGVFSVINKRNIELTLHSIDGIQFTMDREMRTELGVHEGVLELSTEIVPVLSQSQAESISDRYHFGIRLDCDGADMGSGLKGTFTVSIPYSIGEGQNPSDVRVYCVHEDGFIEPMDSVYVDGRVYFKTGHFSVFMIGESGLETVPEEDRDHTIVTISIAATVLLAAIAGIFMFRRRNV